MLLFLDFLFFWFSITTVSYTLILLVSQLQTQQNDYVTLGHT